MLNGLTGPFLRSIMNKQIDEAIELLRGTKIEGLECDCDVCKALALLEAAKLARQGGAEQPEPELLAAEGTMGRIFGKAKADPTEFTKECREYNFFDAEHPASHKIVGIIKRLGKACDLIDRLTADLKKHGGHTVTCNLTWIREGVEVKCSCGWSKIEKDLKKKEGE